MVPETGFRVSDWDTPLRVNPNRTAGRFNRANSQATQYIALHPLTAWAEYLRFHDLRNAEDASDRRLRVWAIRLDLDEAIEIGFENARDDFGIDPDDLVSDDYTECQRLAERFRRDAAAPKLLVAPSAALPGTKNLVAFGERVMIPYRWEPLDSGDLPASVAAENSMPPDGLVDATRFAGEPHAELEAWRGGRRYEFADLA